MYGRAGLELLPCEVSTSKLNRHRKCGRTKITKVRRRPSSPSGELGTCRETCPTSQKTIFATITNILTSLPISFCRVPNCELVTSEVGSGWPPQVCDIQGKFPTQWDITNDVYFNTSIFPNQAQAPYTLRNFPTVFPDVRTKPLNIADVSVYKQFQITEKVRFQLHCDAHNVGNFPWMSQTWGGHPDPTSDVTSSQFGTLQNEMGNEVRMFVMVAKIVF